MKNREVIADVFEAIEKLNQWRPFYRAVLKQTGDKEQAKKALRFVMRMESEMEAK